jgi:NAD(P)-dependent dehydrogenase (short-subunit alcohol dehydrogenase family)
VTGGRIGECAATDAGSERVVTRVVLVTGGSRGLGFEIAKRFATLGWQVAICGRDGAALARAAEKIASAATGSGSAPVGSGPVPPAVAAITCDVGRRDDVGHLLEEVRARLGQIDVLVNNAGVITVGALERQTRDDFERAMSTMYWGMVDTSLGVLPEMIGRRAGHIVNITSIGGRVAAPHLLPYSCAKAAAVAFSDGLQAEVARHGVRVITVVPGFMRTGSQEHVSFISPAAAGHRWFTVAGTLPGLSMPAERAARRIVDATLRNKRQLMLTPLAQLVGRFAGVAPTVSSYLLDGTCRLLAVAEGVPRARVSPGGERRQGEELTGGLPAPTRRLERRAAASGNQFG